RRVLARCPDHADALHSLGILANMTGRPDAAIDLIARAIAVNPAVAEYHGSLGESYGRSGRWSEAIASLRRAVELKPDYAEAHNNLGNALQGEGRFDEAIAAYARAIQLKPDHARAHSNLGNALQAKGRLDDAIAAYSRAIQLEPEYAKAHNNLGNALQSEGRLDEAIAAFERAIAVNPDLAEAHNNLGVVFKDQGRLDEALACFRGAVERKPDFSGAASNVLYTLYFHPDYDARAILAEHRRWDARFADPLADSIRPHPNDPSPDRRLRIGYVSPDFRSHPVGLFMVPLLESHHHDNYEIVCYSNSSLADAITGRCRAHADVWREVRGLSDERLALAIRRDRIDILVDLTMHMANGRLLVFARKPAPVQVTYLAYCGTTGLGTMDYRLTDPYLDPPGQEERPYSERSIHLGETYWCYRPAVQTPPRKTTPASQAGHITFGCLNNFCKVTAPTLEVWSRLLRAMPEARLLLHADAGSHRDRVRDFLTRQGVSPDRLTFSGRMPTPDYFRMYERIDVALDPFPYGGGTTTCDALWMGVPVVTLAGQTAVGRGGLSILSNVGLSDLVARDSDEYVRICLELARDRSRLNELRASLRARMQRSPLMDAPRFARGIEAIYRTIWGRWCARCGPQRPT
ncbi:MAG: protein O-GlcNAc transferase, partial [Chloroflexota bacterium]|nr:protein O-GlcNAc transferase [Chloroflexota bacterium]